MITPCHRFPVVKWKRNPCTGLERLWGLEEEKEAARFLENQHMKVARFWALGTGHLYPQEIFLVLISVTDWDDLQARVRSEVQRTAPQVSPLTPATCIAATTPGMIVRILNSVFFKFLNYSVTLTRYRPTPRWWSVKIETCRSTFKQPALARKKLQPTNRSHRITHQQTSPILPQTRSRYIPPTPSTQ